MFEPDGTISGMVSSEGERISFAENVPATGGRSQQPALTAGKPQLVVGFERAYSLPCLHACCATLLAC